jgi:vacuolar protein-sorting-associated protein 4
MGNIALVPRMTLAPMSLFDSSQEELAIPPVGMLDFEQSLAKCKPSVGQKDLQQHIQFTNEFGQEG